MDNNQEKLKEYIFELALNSLSLDVEARITQLQSIYVADFRHYYSEIFGIITVIKNDDKYDLQTLAENIRKIFDGIKSKYESGSGGIDREFFLKAKKLYDHINLDVARFKYISTVATNLEHTIQKNNENLQKELQKDYVTILGIFAAVIVAFVSGMTFSTSVLNNIDKVDIRHLTFVVILIALVLFNLLNLLFDFLQKINKISFSNGHSVLFWINVALLCALGLDVFAWCFADNLKNFIISHFN